MWNTHYSNRKCNEIEKIREHKMHLERIVTVKSALDMKEPKKPRFLVERSKKEKMEEEKKNKIFYENNILLGKIIEIEKKPSPYNPFCLVPARCPAYDKTTFQIKKKKFEIDNENLKLYRRLVSAKPHYKTHEVLNDYIQSKYYENLISNSRNRINPSLLFETPLNFRKKLEGYLASPENQGNPNTEVYIESKQRPQSVGLSKISSAYPDFYSKKPQSGISKASTNTQYITAFSEMTKMK